VWIRITTLAVCIGVMACGARPVELGFWIEPVSFASPRIGGAISASELATIEVLSRSEIVKAFEPFDVPLTANRNARYSVRVVQRLNDALMFRKADVAGQSWAASGFGGSGEVSFDFVANGAMVYSPEDAPRSAVIEALGRALGRVAVHEFAHQLVPHKQIHDTRDPNSYESPVSAAQYFGDMHWDIAGPVLEQRLKRR
jgi:hypothetical protein